MRSLPRTVLVFNLAMATFATGALAAEAPEGFVRVRGTEFSLGDRPFRFVGVNAAVQHGPERARAAETLAAAAADGFGVVRVWALGEGDHDAEEWRRDGFLFRTGPNGWVERAFQQLDTVVAGARAAGVRLIVVLSNSWKDYGGVPQYLRWLGFRNVDAFGYEDRFYDDPRAFTLYEEHVRRVIGRTNTQTGVAYRDEPTILAWELMNESHVSRRGIEARGLWIRKAAALVKSLDANHLVTVGHAGYGTDVQRAAWIADHEAPEIDYADHHLYLEEVGGVRRLQDIYDRIDDRAQLARFVLKKPLVLGEVGFNNQDARWMGLTRAELHERAVERALADGASGVLAWIYLPPGIERRRFPIQWGNTRHADLRAALGRAAALAKVGALAPNPRLREALGAARLYPRFSVGGQPEVAALARPRRGGAGVLEGTAAAMRYAAGRWEMFGTWAEEPPPHAWGGETGHFEYAFSLPRGAPTAVDLEARVSSEFPGRVAPPDGASRVLVSMEGAPVGEWTAPPDDGRGRVLKLTSTDPAVLERLGGGVVRVRLEVPEGPSANGLSVYDPGVTLRVRYGPERRAAPILAR